MYFRQQNRRRPNVQHEKPHTDLNQSINSISKLKNDLGENSAKNIFPSSQFLRITSCTFAKKKKPPRLLRRSNIQREKPRTIYLA